MFPVTSKKYNIQLGDSEQSPTKMSSAVYLIPQTPKLLSGIFGNYSYWSKSFIAFLFILLKKLQAQSRCTDEADCLPCLRHLGCYYVTHVTQSSIPLYPIQPSLTSHTKFHPINKDVPYRFWNLFSDGFVYTAGTNGSNVTCDGSSSAGANSK